MKKKVKCLACNNKMFFLGCEKLGRQKVNSFVCLKCNTPIFIPVPKKNYLYIDKFGKQNHLTKIILK